MSLFQDLLIKKLHLNLFLLTFLQLSGCVAQVLMYSVKPFHLTTRKSIQSKKEQKRVKRKVMFRGMSPFSGIKIYVQENLSCLLY